MRTYLQRPRRMEPNKIVVPWTEEECTHAQKRVRAAEANRRNNTRRLNHYKNTVKDMHRQLKETESLLSMIDHQERCLQDQRELLLLGRESHPVTIRTLEQIVETHWDRLRGIPELPDEVEHAMLFSFPARARRLWGMSCRQYQALYKANAKRHGYETHPAGFLPFAVGVFNAFYREDRSFVVSYATELPRVVSTIEAVWFSDAISDGLRQWMKQRERQPDSCTLCHRWTRVILRHAKLCYWDEADAPKIRLIYPDAYQHVVRHLAMEMFPLFPRPF